MSDKDYTSQIEGLIGGTLDTFVVCAGSGNVVSQKSVSQVRTLLSITNVDNTSDVDKPVSTAQATADALRVLKSGDTMTGALSLGASSLTCGAITASGVAQSASILATSNAETRLVYTNSAASSNGTWCLGIGSGGQLGHGLLAIGIGSTISAANRCLLLQSGGNVQIGNPTASILTSASPILDIRPVISTTTATGGIVITTNGNGALVHTTGATNLLVAGITFSPTSGTGTHTQLAIQGTINQTGGASGITRGIYVKPTLTSAADFRAIEVASGATVLKTVTCTTIAASGGMSQGPITYAVLNATPATVELGEYRVTDRANRRAYPDGTNWRWVADDAIIS